MRLAIRHTTTYRYTTPVAYSIQQFRLTPQHGATQTVKSWHVQAPGKTSVSTDAYGNVMHTLVLRQPHQQVVIEVSGEVDAIAMSDGRLCEAGGTLPLLHFTAATRLTMPDDNIIALANQTPSLSSPGHLLKLAERIAEKVTYVGGVTAVTSSAAEALQLGKGVCQDHAQLMLACCRARGLPARYVSGYLHSGEVAHAASHAWVDVWLPEAGWITIDVTHACFAVEQYCRIAVGRDYESAAPVRGTRLGGGDERLEVTVAVYAGAMQQ